MNRIELMQKMDLYNPKWQKFLIPYIDGIVDRLPDHNNLELEYYPYNIETISKCVVGEFYNFTDNYWNYEHDRYCHECSIYARKFDSLYELSIDPDHSNKLNMQYVKFFRDNLVKFYTHIEISHNGQ